MKTNSEASELIPSGLEINIISNNMPFVDIEIKTDQDTTQIEVGFGKVLMRIDGTAQDPLQQTGDNITG